ncbi:hypothetical protein GGS26DRAFT_146116 [Hypomontagnella submonticulosa]|nr:hypothetical protein GGS26DRAFT_146116 [Hypomontagnella submonticulosa]
MQPTQALLKRFRKLPLTTKDIKKGFYKGTRTGSMGRHTKFGGYIIDWNKCPRQEVDTKAIPWVRKAPSYILIDGRQKTASTECVVLYSNRSNSLKIIASMVARAGRVGYCSRLGQTMPPQQQSNVFRRTPRTLKAPWGQLYEVHDGQETYT